MSKLVSAVLVGAVLAFATSALAFGAFSGSVYKVSATLAKKAEVPAPKGAAGAKGTFAGTYVENKKGATLKWKLVFSGLTGSATAAHIHSGKPGVAGAVIVPLCTPCKSGMTGTATISKATIAALEGGKAYVNVHTVKNPGGEIRGQIKVAG
jgi:hypothetical protein